MNTHRHLEMIIAMVTIACTTFAFLTLVDHIVSDTGLLEAYAKHLASCPDAAVEILGLVLVFAFVSVGFMYGIQHLLLSNLAPRNDGSKSIRQMDTPRTRVPMHTNN